MKRQAIAGRTKNPGVLKSSDAAGTQIKAPALDPDRAREIDELGIKAVTQLLGGPSAKLPSATMRGTLRVGPLRAASSNSSMVWNCCSSAGDAPVLIAVAHARAALQKRRTGARRSPARSLQSTSCR